MHREYTSSYAAKLVIKKDQMYTENANRVVTIDTDDTILGINDTIRGTIDTDARRILNLEKRKAN